MSSQKIFTELIYGPKRKCVYTIDDICLRLPHAGTLAASTALCLPFGSSKATQKKRSAVLTRNEPLREKLEISKVLNGPPHIFVQRVVSLSKTF